VQSLATAPLPVPLYQRFHGVNYPIFSRKSWRWGAGDFERRLDNPQYPLPPRLTKAESGGIVRP